MEDGGNCFSRSRLSLEGVSPTGVLPFRDLMVRLKGSTMTVSVFLLFFLAELVGLGETGLRRAFLAVSLVLVMVDDALFSSATGVPAAELSDGTRDRVPLAAAWSPLVPNIFPSPNLSTDNPLR